MLKWILADKQAIKKTLFSRMLLVSFARFVYGGGPEKKSFSHDRKDFQEKGFQPLSNRKGEPVGVIRLLLLLNCKQAKSK